MVSVGVDDEGYLLQDPCVIYWYPNKRRVSNYAERMKEERNKKKRKKKKKRMQARKKKRMQIMKKRKGCRQERRDDRNSSQISI